MHFNIGSSCKDKGDIRRSGKSVKPEHTFLSLNFLCNKHGSSSPINSGLLFVINPYLSTYKDNSSDSEIQKYLEKLACKRCKTCQCCPSIPDNIPSKHWAGWWWHNTVYNSKGEAFLGQRLLQRYIAILNKNWACFATPAAWPFICRTQKYNIK